MSDESLLDADFLVQATDGLTCAFEDDDGQEFNPNFFNENDKKRNSAHPTLNSSLMRPSPSGNTRKTQQQELN
jgi:hypothetical protein